MSNKEDTIKSEPICNLRRAKYKTDAPKIEEWENCSVAVCVEFNLAMYKVPHDQNEMRSYSSDVSQWNFS